jgi:hypothetical protein
MDLFVVPTLSFRLLYGLVILWHGRRRILWLSVMAHNIEARAGIGRAAGIAFMVWSQMPAFTVKRGRLLVMALSLAWL